MICMLEWIKYLISKPNMTYWRSLYGHSIRLCLLVTRFAQISGEILDHSSLQKLSKSFRFLGCCLATRSCTAVHRFSKWLKAGDWFAHFITLILFLNIFTLLVLAMFCVIFPFEELSLVFWLKKEDFCPRLFWYLSSSLSVVKLSWNLSRKKNGNKVQHFHHCAWL